MLNRLYIFHGTSPSHSIQMKVLWLKTNIWAHIFLFFSFLYCSPWPQLRTGAKTNTRASMDGLGRWMSLSLSLLSITWREAAGVLGYIRLLWFLLLNRIRGPLGCFLWPSEDVCGDRLLSFIDQVEELSEQKALNQGLWISASVFVG